MATVETSRTDQPVTQAPARMRYVPALDGLRGLSLPGTIFTHYAIFLMYLPSAPHWLSYAGPFTLNIEMFFALSGALITSLLVSEHQRTGTVSLRKFYVRRSRRLGPALLFTLGALLLVQPFLSGPDLLPLGDHAGLAVGSMLVFLGNWMLFSQGGAPLGWMGPAWTLGIEEQFYLTWPTLLVLVLRAGWRRAQVLVGLALLTVLFLALSIAFDDRYDPRRVFYMTTTQVPVILVGCALGFVLATSPGCWLAQLLRSRLVALVGLLVMVLMSVQLDTSSHFLNRGGFLLYGAAACLLIGHLMVRSGDPTVFSKVLGWRVFVWIGQVSYEAYLIHCVVILAVLRVFPTLDVTLMIAIDTALIFGLSAAFYYGVGEPIRRRGWKAGLLRRLRRAPALTG